MVEKGDKVWLFHDDHLCTIFATEKKCREAYLAQLNYYKGLRIKKKDDKWKYKVWNEVDEPTGNECSMHYANIDAFDEYGGRRSLFISYACRIVQ